MSKYALSVCDLSYSYATKNALNNVSFDIPTGSFCALLGPNGAGKSTLFSVLTGLVRSPDGAVSVLGHDLASYGRIARKNIGVVFQQPTLDLDVSVRENLLYFAALHGISRRRAKPRITDALDRLSMGERADEKLRNLNGGHRRRMEIARALVHEPSILLLDEPTVGLDHETRQSITQYVHQLCDDGITILWATHLVDEIYPADQMVLLHHGQVLETGQVSDVVGTNDLAHWFSQKTVGA
ncbi:ABC transporter ATP-binding protein [Amylibacter kogurei]|uniref:ABC transporter ATP-binding protein n=1 Tax=Paramylibacter kogurei TaxID=1889778 RepID=A0A2G5K516_9RHOB|nr:ABC transporter ATP-binding protein [Amylibacter kogurei]PIB24626.1 ABC transporter ATP-binding protein [Amylibacter kogurei]